jgi:hypothetical protein
MEKIIGGKADNLNLMDISNKFNVPIDEIEKEFLIGVEMEHTNNIEIAKEIALDHLSEIPDYYSRLVKMEKETNIKETFEKLISELELTRHYKERLDGRVRWGWDDAKTAPDGSHIEKEHLDSSVYKTVTDKVNNLTKYEFDIPNNEGLSVKLYTHNKMVFHDKYPKEQRDKGNELWGTIRNNNLDSLYWKPPHLKPQTDKHIDYETLNNYLQNNPNIGTIKKPIKSHHIDLAKKPTKVTPTELKGDEFLYNKEIYVIDKNDWTIFPKAKPSDKIDVNDSLFSELPERIQNYLVS